MFGGNELLKVVTTRTENIAPTAVKIMANLSKKSPISKDSQRVPYNVLNQSFKEHKVEMEIRAKKLEEFIRNNPDNAWGYKALGLL
jgi:putative IMPACT (imprinted ancient) family translation regulator